MRCVAARGIFRIEKGEKTDMKLRKSAEKAEQPMQNGKSAKTKKILFGIGIPVGLLALVTVALLAALAVRTEPTPVTEPSTEPLTTAVADRELPIAEGADDFVEGDFTPIPITLGAQGLAAFEQYLQSVSVDYDYAAYYNIDNALERYADSTVDKVQTHSHDIRVNGVFDKAYFYKLVKKNNDDFIDGKSEYGQVYFYEEYSNKKLREYCDYILDTLPAIFEKYPEIDVDTVCCNLYDLKILATTATFDNAAVNSRNVLHFDEKKQEMNKNLMHTDDIYNTTFVHELIHLCRIGCNDYEGNGEWVIGDCRDYEDLEINPLAWYWLEEATAEELMSRYLGVPYTTYIYKVGYLKSLNLVTALGKIQNALSVEYAGFDHDLEDFFARFDLTGQSEKEEIIKMMYSIEIVQSSSGGFYDKYKELYGISPSEDEAVEAELRLCLKEDALLTMTKLFYRNLARQIHSGNVTLQDAYYLMRLFEVDLDFHFSNDTYAYMVRFQDFYTQYCAIQDKFFETLAKENGKTAAALQTGFETYSMNVRNGEAQKSPNCDLQFLAADKKKQVLEYCEYIYKKGYPSMRACIEIAEKCKAEM